MAANADTGAGTTNARAVLMTEIGPDGIAQESPIISYTEKVSHHSLKLVLWPSLLELCFALLW